jgi:hypothetical protein
MTGSVALNFQSHPYHVHAVPVGRQLVYIPEPPPNQKHRTSTEAMQLHRHERLNPYMNNKSKQAASKATVQVASKGGHECLGKGNGGVEATIMIRERLP